MGTRQTISAGNAARAIAASFHRGTGLKLEHAFAATLWDRVRPRILDRDDRGLIRDVEESKDGRLDTCERETLMDYIAVELIGEHWPMNCTSEEVSQRFFEKLEVAVRSGAIVLVPDAAAGASA